MPVVINGTTGITNVNGSAAAPAETGIDTDTGVYYGTNTVGLATNGTAALQIDSSQNVSLTAGLAVAGNNISAVNSLGFRNRIINGAMVIDQRNAGASVTPVGGQYLLDRFMFGALTQTSKLSGQQSTVAPSGFTNSTLITSLSAYSVISTDVFEYGQRIEGFNVSDLGWGAAGATSVTLSFWVRSSLTGTFGGRIANANQNYCYPFSFSINSANTWEYKTIVVAGPTTGTWDTSNGVGLRVFFSLGAGSSMVASAGSWVAGDYRGVPGQVNLVGTNGATFYITGVQLEAGSVATPFERRDYGRELIMCQRYYYAANLPSGTSINGNAAGGGAVYDQRFFYIPVSMRTSPTYTFSSSSNTNVTSISVVKSWPEGFMTNTITAAAGYFQVTNIQYTASAEL